MLMESAGTTNTNGQTQARSPENYNRKEVVVMKTLEQAYADFNFENMVQEHLVGNAENINAYTECCGRYLGQNRTALIWEGKNGDAEQWTFEQLAVASGQLANYMHSLGLKAGDCIAGLLPRTPALLITILATWRIGAIYQPLFTAFESKAIEHRISTANTQLIVTDEEQRLKLHDLNVPNILTVHQAAADNYQDADFWTALQQQPEEF